MGKSRTSSENKAWSGRGRSCIASTFGEHRARHGVDANAEGNGEQSDPEDEQSRRRVGILELHTVRHAVVLANALARRDVDADSQKILVDADGRRALGPVKNCRRERALLLRAFETKGVVEERRDEITRPRRLGMVLATLDKLPSPPRSRQERSRASRFAKLFSFFRRRGAKATRFGAGCSTFSADSERGRHLSARTHFLEFNFVFFLFYLF